MTGPAHEAVPRSPSALRRDAVRWLAEGRHACVVQVLHTAGSVPREAGARLLVSADAACGSIGGGHLEWQAIAQARARLAAASTVGDPAASAPTGVALPPGAARLNDRPPGPSPDWPVHTAEHALGPSLGQCCGGRVRLGWAPLNAQALADWPEPAPRWRVQLHGAGHVGQAVAQMLLGLEAEVHWVDERPWPLPPPTPRLAADFDADALAAIGRAEPGSVLLVMTHRHDLDLALLQRALRRDDWAFVGLIGSATKRARFERRLREAGIAEARLQALHCPVGLPGVGDKSPAEIAVAVAAQLLQQVAAPAA